MTVFVDVLTDSKRPSENPESWREGERVGKSQGDSFVFIREGGPVERDNAGPRAADRHSQTHIGQALLRCQRRPGGLDSVEYEALYMCCG